MEPDPGSVRGWRCRIPGGPLDDSVASQRFASGTIHLGDYIYEYANGTYGPAGFAGVTRAHDPATEIITLADYRRRHACYKADGDLRQLHAAHPFIATWDDHESANNAWRDGAENHTEFEEGLWSVRKSQAIQAFFGVPVGLTTPVPLNVGARGV